MSAHEPQQPYQQPYVPSRGTAEGATAALVLGVLSLAMCGFLTGIPAIFMGGKARRAVDASQGQLEGRGLATAGVVLGWIGTIYTLGLVVLFGAAVMLGYSTNG